MARSKNNIIAVGKFVVLPLARFYEQLIHKYTSLFILGLLCLLPMLSSSQNEANIWYFGNGSGLNFSTNPPTVLNNGSITTSVGCTSICGPTGNLLFYSDGQTIWNQTHAVMANGTGLLGNPGAQNIVVVKKPQSANLYYVFTVQGGGGSAGFCYSIVDMALAAGNGSVITKNVPIYSFACEEKISATKHCNQTDAWIVVHPANTNAFVSVALTAAGVGSVVISNPTTYNFPFANTTFTHSGYSPFGSLKFSHNGRRFAEVFTQPVLNTTTTTNYSAMVAGTSIIEYGGFDNATGQITDIAFNVGSIGNGAYSYGTEFSPDGTKMYYIYWAGLYQVDFCMYPPTSNGGIIEYGDPLPTFQQRRASLQCGPDGRIYVANPGLTSLGVIGNPNASGSACMYTPQAIPLGTVCGYGLPNFYTPYFEKTGVTFTAFPVAGNNCQTFSFLSPTTCVTQTFVNIIYSGYTVTTTNWNFGDPASGAANTSTIPNPTHSFSAPGTYTVQLLKSYFCGRTDTINNVIVVPPSPINTIVTPSLSCGTTSAYVTTSLTVGAPSYTWLPANITGSVALGLVPNTHTVVTKDNGTGCIITTTFSTYSVTIYNTVTAPTLCAGTASGNATVTTYNGSGNYQYTWSGSASTASTSIALSPGAHLVTVMDPSSSCSLSTSFQIYVAPAIQVIAVKNVNGVLCTGQACTLVGFASGGIAPYSFSWTPSSITVNTVPVTQNLPGTYNYTLQITDAIGCQNIGTVAVQYAPTPTVVVASSYTVCAGGTIAIVPSGAPSYILLPGTFFTSTTIVQPSSTSAYTIVGQTQFCSAAVTTTVFTLPSPNFSLYTNAPLCAGNTLSLVASGAQNYNWSGAASFSATGANAIITQASVNNSGVYFCTATAQNSCTTTNTIQVLINANPSIFINGSNVLCAGQALQLNAVGAQTFTWSGGGLSSQTSQLLLPSVSPTNSAIYVVSGTNSLGCVSSSSINVSVTNYPNITISTSSLICAGTSLTLTAAGASTYSWNNGATSSSIIITPFSNSVYNVIGYNGVCSATAQTTVKVTNCNGLQAFEGAAEVNIYPNPFTKTLTIETSLPSNYIVIDMLGKIILEGNVQAGANEILFSTVDDGVYFLQLFELNQTIKLVKSAQ